MQLKYNYAHIDKIPKGKIFVEGHTDNVPVSKPVTEFHRFGAVYDDNSTLSVARAREARKYIIGSLAKKKLTELLLPAMVLQNH